MSCGDVTALSLLVGALYVGATQAGTKKPALAVGQNGFDSRDRSQEETAENALNANQTRWPALYVQHPVSVAPDKGAGCSSKDTLSFEWFALRWSWTCFCWLR